MSWTPQQSAALLKVRKWFSQKDKPFFTLGGWAGTGKSTIAQHIAETLGVPTLFMAYTGKAAYVLKRKGVQDVSTVHKAIYTPKGKATAAIQQLQQELLNCSDEKRKKEINYQLDNLSRPSFALRNDSPLSGCGLVILDEYSMISQQMGEDLLSFGCPILALGDPGQLPPPFGTSFFTGPPDVMLTDIQRQARDNPIIHLATLAREGKNIPLGEYGDSQVVRRGGNSEAVREADQLLVGMNKSREAGNRNLRRMLGFKGDFPNAGEKLVCLKNNADVGFFNGQTWKTLENATVLDDCLGLSLEDEEGLKAGALAQTAPFLGQQLDRFTDFDTFDYGYALTVHKSQGSQWDKVALLDEWYGNHRDQWLYTGITRAAEKLTIIRNA